MMTPEGTRTAFDVWVAEREKLCDQANWFWRDGGLNKTKIYKACGLSGYQPFNSYLKPRFDEIEKDWIARGLAAPQKAAPKLVKAASKPVHSDDPNAKKLEEAERRIKALEERNAVLMAELRKLKRVAQHLDQTGRLLPP
ncbi:MAG: hypothetical protein KIT32_16515 [Rhodocyclaceae bacterium]|nr:hypothetical protein [Rhodocyclaceae bacterium]